MKRIVSAVVAPVVGLGLLTAPHARAAESEAGAFYKAHHDMKIVIGAGPAGGYDIYARLIARHMGSHIPGNPTLTPINMPGASGIKAANWVAEEGPQDGTIISSVRFNFAMFQALGNLPEVKTDIRKFHWLGSINATNHVLATYYKAPFKTFNDITKTQVLIGEASPRSDGTLLCNFFNAMIHTRIKVITGYRDMAKVKLAMERGEVQGIGDDGWADLKSNFPDMIKRHQINILLQLGLKKEPDLPDVPLLNDLAKTPEQKAIFDFITESIASMGKPFATSPGVPADRVALLRKAFDETMKDPGFLADAKKLDIYVNPISGADIQGMIADVRGAPKSVTGPVRSALGLDTLKKKKSKHAG
jgi:tripartite-type tricarboxylate transporter receptor subunit TctC